MRLGMAMTSRDGVLWGGEGEGSPFSFEVAFREGGLEEAEDGLEGHNLLCWNSTHVRWIVLYPSTLLYSLGNLSVSAL